MKNTLIKMIVSEYLRGEKGNPQALEKFLPSGSGFDCGTKIIDYKNDNLILMTEFHHMNENGFYDGWTRHTITVKPDLYYGIKISIAGPNKNDIKDYMYDVFYDCLAEEIYSKWDLQNNEIVYSREDIF